MYSGDRIDIIVSKLFTKQIVDLIIKLYKEVILLKKC